MVSRKVCIPYSKWTVSAWLPSVWVSMEKSLMFTDAEASRSGLITIDSLQKKMFLVPEKGIEGRRSYTHGFGKFADGCCLITSLPKETHGAL